MNLLFWFFGDCYLTAASAVPLTILGTVVDIVLVIFLVLVIGLTLNYFVDGRGGVKFLLLREGWLMGVDRWLNGVRKPSISDRRASITGDHWEQVQGMLNSSLLKQGTFMVLILNGYCFPQWLSVSLARDAYNA